MRFLKGAKQQMSQSISALPVKAKVKDTSTTYYGVPIIWEIGDKNHAGYPANSVTLVAANILKLACFDAMESGNSDSNRRRYGNNRYSLSNLRQWLNKAGSPWYQAQHGADAAPTNANVWSNYNEYDDEAGFLTGFSAQMLAAILNTTLTVAKASVDGGGSETVTDKVFLLSKAEVGLGAENGVSEGSTLAMFSDNTSRQCRPTAQAVSNSEYTSSSLSASQPWWYYLRSPSASYSYNVRYVYSGGTLDNRHAYYGSSGVRPALYLKSDISVSLDGNDESTIEVSEEELYKAAVQKFGERAQILVANEEMSELTKALLKYIRHEDFNQGDYDDIVESIAEERADVSIMLNQLAVIFGKNEDAETEKLEHLADIVKDAL